MDSADFDPAEQRETLNVGEAEGASDADRDLCGQGAERGLDVANLLFDPGDELGLVATVDPQDRASFCEQAAGPVFADLAGVGFGVDHRHAGGSNGDVVDVRVAVAGDASVMEQTDACAVKQLLEARTGTYFALAALLPGACA